MTPDHAHRETSAWRTLGHALVPRATSGQLITGLLCAMLGFGLVVQVQANRTDGLTTLRQDELVRLLDEVTRRGDELETQASSLRAQRTELVTGSDTERAAREAAAERSVVQGILAGEIPAQGPGVELTIDEPDDPIPAPVLYNVLEELRNAGAEAIQVGDRRLTASSYFIDTPDGVEVDGALLDPPYHWLAIGDPETITTALNIPGGALAAIRNASGTAELESRFLVEVTAVRDVRPPRYATPAPVLAE